MSNAPIGVCTWTFGDLSLPEIAHRVAGLGFDGVELMGDLAISPRVARRILEDQGLAILSLTPANVDLAHPDGPKRRAALGYYRALLDFAAESGRPLVGIHGDVGRVRPIRTQAEEYALFVEGVRQVAEGAAARGLRLALEVLNRYESHLVNTAAQAVAFVDRVAASNLGILLDAYHMNIEEPDPAAALRSACGRLALYHAADSNRQGIGRGHTDFGSQIAALAEIGYAGPIILECTASGPDPFTPVKDGDWRAELETYLRESLAWLRARAGRGADERS